MKFFVKLKLVTFPDTKDELKKVIIDGATLSAQENVFSFFTAYFENKQNGVEHPILGNLLSLAAEIDAKWDEENYGLNLVSGLIKHRLRDKQGPVQDTPKASFCP